ncbi:DNA mismatch endonuclease Vsr [Reinekea sp. G2M2-21]|uniref:very short patch repair endonuclease n=1 Tax=Reinekea sp. G2M2-21 TaxID=2788942 RepID=UPI0018A8EDE1
MVDVHDKGTRSRNMRAIHRSGTKPELWVRKCLFAEGYRYRLGEHYKLHKRYLPGKPDLVLPKYDCVIFIHGCFWHRHLCRDFKWPGTREQFWRLKLNSNAERDRTNVEELLKNGWRVLVIWEFAIRGKGRVGEEDFLEVVKSFLKSDKNLLELEPMP